MADEKPNTKTVERVIKAQFFRYTKLNAIPGSTEVRPVMATARRGDTVQVLEAEALRGDSLGAFHSDAEVKQTESGDAVVEVDVREMSDAELASWIKSDKPTVPEVVEQADDDPALAERLMNAERTATDGKPRATLNKALTEIIDKAAAAGTPGLEVTGTP